MRVYLFYGTSACEWVYFKGDSSALLIWKHLGVGCESRVVSECIQAPTFKSQQEITEKISNSSWNDDETWEQNRFCLFFFTPAFTLHSDAWSSWEGRGILTSTFIFVRSHGYRQREKVESRSEEARGRSSGRIASPNQASCTSKGDLEDDAEDDETKLGPGNEILDAGLSIAAQIIYTEIHWDTSVTHH